MGPKSLSVVVALIVGAMIPAIANAGRVNAANEPEYVPGEVIVGYKNIPAKRELRCAKDCVTGEVHWRKMRHAPFAKGKPGTPHPLARVRIIKLQPGEDVPEAAARLSALPSVAYAHPNYITRAAFSPNDILFSTEQYGPQTIRLPEAWDLTVGRGGVVVAVADSGFRLDHEDFADTRIWANSDPVNGIDDDGNGFVDDFRGWDFMNNDNNPATFGAQGDHGTHVMGILAASTNNQKGIAGVAQCTVMPLQVLNGLNGTWAAIAEAIEYAVDNGADVVNYSAGGPGGAGILRDAVEYAHDNDVVVVGAAGNNNSAVLYFPAAYPGAIAVAATDINDARYFASNFGDYIDISAPGVAIHSTFATEATAYGTLEGTSQAAPHVSGLIALMLSIDPTLTIEEIRGFLRDNAVDLGAVGYDEFFGAGRIDARATLDAVELASAPPAIVHDGGSTIPPSGYIDPRDESSNGFDLDLGIDTIQLTFNKPVRDINMNEGGGLTIDAFTIAADEAVATPTIVAVETSNNINVTLTLSSPIPVGAWTTIVADVEDFAGRRIVDLGNQGPGVDESDRIDIGFLPGDVDQSATVSPFDLFRFRQLVFEVIAPEFGTREDFIDTDRSGTVNPVDLLHFRNLIVGNGAATQSWSGVSLQPQP